MIFILGSGRGYGLKLADLIKVIEVDMGIAGV
jgi:hypothetical protein